MDKPIIYGIWFQRVMIGRIIFILVNPRIYLSHRTLQLPFIYQLPFISFGNMDGISSSSSFASGEEEEESAYDLIRRQNMIQNRDVFASLGFGDPYPGMDLGDSKTKKVLYLPPLSFIDV